MTTIVTLNQLFKDHYTKYNIIDFKKDYYKYTQTSLDLYFEDRRYDNFYDQTRDMQEKINEFFRIKFEAFKKTPEYQIRNKSYISVLEQLYNHESPLLKSVKKAPKDWI